VIPILVRLFGGPTTCTNDAQRLVLCYARRDGCLAAFALVWTGAAALMVFVAPLRPPGHADYTWQDVVMKVVTSAAMTAGGWYSIRTLFEQEEIRVGALSVEYVWRVVVVLYHRRIPVIHVSHLDLRDGLKQGHTSESGMAIEVRSNERRILFARGADERLLAVWGRVLRERIENVTGRQLPPAPKLAATLERFATPKSTPLTGESPEGGQPGNPVASIAPAAVDGVEDRAKWHGRTLWALLTVCAILTAFGFAFHLALELHDPLAYACREFYTSGGAGMKNGGWGPWAIFDFFLPAMASGVLFGKLLSHSSSREAFAASLAVGLTSTLLELAYPHFVTYNAWWMPGLNGVFDVTRHTLLIAGICWIIQDSLSGRWAKRSAEIAKLRRK